MSRYIVTHKSGKSTFSNAFIVAGNYDNSLHGFRLLLLEAQKDFPDLTEESAECRTVLKSGWCQGCPALRFSVEPNTVRDGWLSVNDRLPDIVL